MASGFSLGTAYVDIKSRGMAGLQSDIKKVNTGFNAFGKSVGRARDAQGKFVSQGKAGMRGLTDGIGKATGALGGLSIAAAGASTGILAISAAGATLVKSVRASGNLEQSLAEVATISENVEKNMKGVTAEINRLSISTRTASGLLAEGLYQTISSGITDTAEAMKVLEVSANAGRAGLTTVGTAVNGLTSALNAYNFSASDAESVSDKYFATVRAGKLRMEDLANSIGNVAPIASQMGVSLDELLASGAALTLTGQSLSESFTQIRSIMTAVLKPTKEATDIAEQLGIDFSATALRTKGFTGFLKDLEVQTGGNNETIAALLGRVEGISGVMALAGNQADDYARILNDVQNSTGATEKAVAIQNKTFNSQVDLLKNNLNVALIKMGNELLPTVESAVKSLNESLEKVDWKSFGEGINSVLELFGTFAKTSKGLAELLDKIFSLPGKLNREAVQQLQGASGKKDDPLADIQGTGFVPFSQAPKEFSQGTIAAVTVSKPIVATPENTFLSAPGKEPKTQPKTQPKPSLETTVAPSLVRGQRQQNAFEAIRGQRPGLRTAFLPSQRALRPLGTTGGFVAPQGVRTGTNIANVTRAPIPGVTGELVSPALGIKGPTPASVAPTSEKLGALEFPTTLPDNLKNFADAVGEMPSILRPATEELGVALEQDLTPILKAESARLAEGFSLVSSAIEGGAAGGLPGALIAVGTEILSITEGFGRIQESFNNVVGNLVEAIDPVVSALADVLEPVFSALGDVLKELTPVFKATGFVLKQSFGPALKLVSTLLGTLASAIRFVVNGFIKMINGVIGLINKIPGIEIRKIQEVGAQGEPPSDETRIKEPTQDPATRTTGTRDTTRGLQISQITGPTRDILVDLLRPLRTLDTTFPAMLDELRNIRTVLTPGFRIPSQSAVPNTPAIGNFAARQEFQANANITGGRAENARGGVVINNPVFQIHVNQVTDVDIELLERQLQERLNLDRRGAGEVFPNG